MRVLINSGADINKAKDGIWTPLFIAAQEGLGAVLRTLIEAGARGTGVMPLFIAAQIRFVALVRALIGAVITAFRRLL